MMTVDDGNKFMGASCPKMMGMVVNPDLASSALPSRASSVTTQTESDSELSFSDGHSLDDDLSHEELSSTATPLLMLGVSTNNLTVKLAQSRDEPPNASFTGLRLTYLLVTLVIMLADGLQGGYCFRFLCFLGNDCDASLPLSLFL